MPTFPEQFVEAVGRRDLTRDHVVILHPQDFNTLRMIVQREGWDPSFAVNPTIHGARIVADAAHPPGSFTVLDLGSTSLMAMYGQGFSTIMAPSKPSPSPPAPRSLWERLDEDE